MTNLVLFIPDIFKPLQLKNEAAIKLLPEVPALSALISRAQRFQFNASNCIETLFRLFDIDIRPNQPYPVAALTYLAEVGDPGDDWLVRIDPVHLQIDRDHLILLDNHLLKMKDKEAFELIASINQLYQDEDFSIEPGIAGHWYLRFNKDPGVRAHSIYDVIGKNIEPYLMSGEQRQYWQSIMNEIQMLLHTHPINEKRARDGQLTVNSVWLWGEGTLADYRDVNDAGLWRSVHCSNNLCVGLGKFTGLTVEAVPSNIVKWIESGLAHNHDSDGKVLVMLSDLYSCVKYGEIELWRNFLTEFENCWAGPLVNALKNGALDSLEIYEGNGRRYLITPRQLKGWWKRKQSLIQSL